MIYKISLSVSGDNFFPERIIDSLVGDFLVKSQNSPNDKKFENKDDLFGFGSILFWHIKKFSLQDCIQEYENFFVKFLEENYDLFINNGGKEFSIYFEIYYDGGQCNFEIFNKVNLEKLMKFKIDIPVSVYTLEEEEFQEWSDEIRLEWHNV